MSKNKKDYSDYVQHSSSLSSVLSLLSGFTFTAFTILLTQLPDPSNIVSQFTLIFLAALFYQLMSLLGWNHLRTIRYCKNVPPESKDLLTFNSLAFLSFMWFGFAIVLMLLIWDLVYLALASAVVWAISIILGHIYVTKPFQEYRKSSLAK